MVQRRQQAKEFWLSCRVQWLDSRWSGGDAQQSIGEHASVHSNYRVLSLRGGVLSADQPNWPNYLWLDVDWVEKQCVKANAQSALR